jgi:hypothetical protein
MTKEDCDIRLEISMTRFGKSLNYQKKMDDETKNKEYDAKALNIKKAATLKR